VHVCSQKHSTHSAWQQVSKDELDGVSVFSSNAYGCDVGVMYLMNVGIDFPPVKETMGEVES